MEQLAPPTLPIAPPAARPAAAGRRRRLPLAAWLGIALLIASAAGAGVLGSHTGQVSPTAADPPAPAAGRAVAMGHVDVEGGVTPVHPLQPGRVARVVAHENDEVEKGAPLLEMDDTLARLQVQEAEIDVAAAEAKLAQARQLPKQHQKQIDAQEEAIAAARADLELARFKRKLARERLENQTGNENELQQAIRLVNRAEAALRAEEKKLNALKDIDVRPALTLAEKNLAAKRVGLDKAKKALDECTVKAPAKGTVLRIHVSEGEALSTQPRQPAILFCAARPRIVRAEVEQEFAGRVALGQTALIVDETTGAGSWRGKVTRVSDWYTHRRSILMEPLQYNDVRTLECIIHLDPNQGHLRIGQRVRVTLEGAGG